MLDGYRADGEGGSRDVEMRRQPTIKITEAIKASDEMIPA